MSVALGETSGRKMPAGTPFGKPQGKPAVLWLGTIIFFLVCSGTALQAAHSQPEAAVKFEISFTSSLRAAPLTGRVYLILSTNNDAEPRLQAGDWDNVVVPMFAIDVAGLQPGAAAVIDAGARGVPMRSLRELPAGDYYAQAVLNVYTECPGADGRDLLGASGSG